MNMEHMYNLEIGNDNIPHKLLNMKLGTDTATHADMDRAPIWMFMGIWYGLGLEDDISLA